MALIEITDLHLRTVIGANDWEREVKQDVIINVQMEFDPARAIESDDINDTVDYKAVTKSIIKLVEGSQFYLIEKLADSILKIVTGTPGVSGATVRVDKPQALRFAQSVSVTLSSE